MNPSPLRRIAAVCVLWLAVGAGCHKDVLTNCKDGSCCMRGTNPQFVKRIEGGRAEYDGFTFGFQDPISIVNGYRLTGAMICEVQQAWISSMHLKSNTTIENNKVRLIDSTHAYPYQVWGIIYVIPEMPNFGGIPTYAIRVEKVESFY